ncbi:MAG: LysE family translocator [Kangiella sp.]|jgi:RhtB (resistance to homoserine/threonine) family protein|nr:LysE family translocator [Kangiella sp.]MCW9029796.1 LysE family translocator [Kangiella sp.]
MIEELITHYWQEFLLMASAHALAVASPGPDFAIVMRQSLVFGRRFAILSSIGIGLAILVHVTYTVLGIGLLIRDTLWLFTAIKVAGAAYLLYIGWQAIGVQKAEVKDFNPVSKDTMTGGKAFRQGFMTNVLNPKATLFFLSLFTTIVDAKTPMGIQALYGIWMSVMTGAWFVFLSLMLTQQRVRQFFASFGHWIDRLLGAFLIILAIMLLFSTVS